eukprot:tig00000632_g2754.t1
MACRTLAPTVEDFQRLNPKSLRVCDDAYADCDSDAYDFDAGVRMHDLCLDAPHVKTPPSSLTLRDVAHAELACPAAPADDDCACATPSRSPSHSTVGGCNYYTIPRMYFAL